MSDDLQREADRRNAKLLEDRETKQWWFVRDSGLVLLPLEAASHQERVHVLAVWDRTIARNGAQREPQPTARVA